MSNKHTPAPWTWTVPGEMYDDCNIPRVAVDWDTWKCKGYGGNPSLTDANGTTIVCAGDGEYVPVREYDKEQGKANARLIAAAPEMLAALLYMQTSLRDLAQCAPTVEELELIDEDLAVIDAAIDEATQP